MLNMHGYAVNMGSTYRLIQVISKLSTLKLEYIDIIQ